jgi:cell division protein FtsB
MKTQFHPKPTPRLSPRLILGFVVALVVFFLLLTSVIGLAEKHTVLRTEIEQLETKQGELKDKQESLAATNEYLKTPEGKEQVFRTKYNVVKPGEGMIIITPQPKLPPPPPPQSAVSRFWDSILEGLGIRGE